MANKLSMLVKSYALCGHPINTSHPMVDLLMKSCKREMSVASRPKVPLKAGHLILIAGMLDQSNMYHKLFSAAHVIQFFACLRKGNLLSPIYEIILSLPSSDQVCYIKCPRCDHFYPPLVQESAK